MITETVERVMETVDPLIVMGDFNCPHIDWMNRKCSGGYPEEKVLFDFCLANGLRQMVSGPTRPQNGILIAIDWDRIFDAADNVEDDCPSLIEASVPMRRSVVTSLSRPASCAYKLPWPPVILRTVKK